MKKLVIIGSLLLLLAGGGAGAWWFYFQDGAEGLPNMTAEPTGQVPLFVDFDPLVVPVIRDGAVTQHLTFTIILQMSSEADRSLVYRAGPMLKDAYLSELFALYSRRLVQDQEDSMPLLRKRLMWVSEQVLGPGTVNSVLINILNKKELVRR